MNVFKGYLTVYEENNFQGRLGEAGGRRRNVKGPDDMTAEDVLAVYIEAEC